MIDLDKFAEEFLNRFAPLLEKRGEPARISQISGVPQSSLSSWGTKNRRKGVKPPTRPVMPSIYDLYRVAHALGQDPSFLAYGIGPDPDQLKLINDFAKLSERDKRIVLAQVAHMQPDTSETDEINRVASRNASDKTAPSEESSQGEAWKIVSKYKVKSSKGNVDLSGARPVPPQEPLPAIEQRAAADHLTGSTAPIVEDTEPWDVRYPRKTHYTLRVQGQSMRPTIFEGDGIIVERLDLYMPPYDEDRSSCDPRPWRELDGQVVVALVDEDLMAVVKRLEVTFRKDTGFKVWLRSDNPRTKSIEIDKTSTLRIVGVVRQIMRDPKYQE